MPKNKNKQNIDDNKLLDFYINENNNLKKITQPSDKLNDVKKQQLSIKLKNTIKQKKNIRFRPDTKNINEQLGEIQHMMKHPKMSNHILELYGKAMASNVTMKLATPIEIFNNIDTYKKQYYKYILELLNKIKQEKLDLLYLDTLLDNPYGHYMSKCLDCPLNPFTKSKPV